MQKVIEVNPDRKSEVEPQRYSADNFPATPATKPEKKTNLDITLRI